MKKCPQRISTWRSFDFSWLLLVLLPWRQISFSMWESKFCAKGHMLSAVGNNSIAVPQKQAPMTFSNQRFLKEHPEFWKARRSPKRVDESSCVTHFRLKQHITNIEVFPQALFKL